MGRRAGWGGVVLGVAVVLGGCGDPRAHLEGLFRAEGTQRVEVGGESRSARVKDLVRVQALLRLEDLGPEPKALTLDIASLDCRLRMHLDPVREGAMLLSEPVVCPPFEATLTQGCLVTLSFTAGVAYRAWNEDSTLELSLSGPLQAVCGDGRAQKGLFTLSLYGSPWRRGQQLEPPPEHTPRALTRLP